MVIKKILDEVLTEESISQYLTEKLNKIDTVHSWDEMQSAYDFLGMTEAVAWFVYTINQNKKITFVLDCDADGMGTYYLAWNFCKVLDYKNIELIMTKRSDGYGFLPQHLNNSTHGDLIITADNGITSHPACKEANSRGINVIITDHHRVDPEFGIPTATVIIDPYQPGDQSKFKDINGTFVFWYFLKSIVDKYSLDLDMTEFLPILMITTISDVMPLHYQNRFIVKEGLRRIEEFSNLPWIKEILNNQQEITAESMAFGVVPFLNATNRLTKSDDALFYLLAQDQLSCNAAYWHCNQVNDVRKDLQNNLFNIIKTDYHSWLEADFVVIPGNDRKSFQKGLLGPTAGKIAEEFKKPTLVLTLNEEGTVYSGSGRSSGNIDILSILKKNKHLIFANGHPQACGVAIEESKLNDFWIDLQKEIMNIPKEDFEPTQTIIGKINIKDVHYGLLETLNKFEPYGKDFEKPIFLSRGKIKKLSKLGKDKQHYSMIIEDGLGSECRAMWFFSNKELSSGSKISFTFTIQKDTYDNKQESIVLFIKSIGDLNDWVN